MSGIRTRAIEITLIFKIRLDSRKDISKSNYLGKKKFKCKPTQTSKLANLRAKNKKKWIPVTGYIFHSKSLPSILTALISSSIGTKTDLSTLEVIESLLYHSNIFKSIQVSTLQQWSLLSVLKTLWVWSSDRLVRVKIKNKKISFFHFIIKASLKLPFIKVLHEQPR
jgi:hypothetical protein